MTYFVCKANPTAMAFVSKYTRPDWIVLQSSTSYNAACAARDIHNSLPHRTRRTIMGKEITHV